MGRLLNVVTPLHTATKRDYMGRMNDDKIGCSGSEGGQCQPARDIPRLVRLGDAGKVSYRGIVTHEFALDDINDALDLMRSGTSGRILLNIS